MDTLDKIDDRSREVFRQLVEIYIRTGEPVGSRTLSQDQTLNSSAATIRNVMADLTDLGLLHAPHISAGRLPTESGLRLFVDSLLQVGDLSETERLEIQGQFERGPVESVLEEAASQLTGLTQSAALVITEKSEAPLRHIEFVPTSPGHALAVLVFADGSVENRVIDLPPGLPPSSLIKGSNYLNARLVGQTLSEARLKILEELDQNKATLDTLTTSLVRRGVVDFSGSRQNFTENRDKSSLSGHGSAQLSSQTTNQNTSLIVRGRGRLLDKTTQTDLERVRMLFDDLERKEELIEMLSAAKDGDVVRIFIGSENGLFSLSGSSVVVAPYKDSGNNLIGVLGVIGPTRLNYARIIPIVDYTAELVSKLLK